MPRQPKPYFSLVERASPTEPWQLAFGAYKRSWVADEMRARRISEYPTTGRRTQNGPDWRIICSSDSQAAIDAAVAKLNAATPDPAAALAALKAMSLKADKGC